MRSVSKSVSRMWPSEAEHVCNALMNLLGVHCDAPIQGDMQLNKKNIKLEDVQTIVNGVSSMLVGMVIAGGGDTLAMIPDVMGRLPIHVAAITGT